MSSRLSGPGGIAAIGALRAWPAAMAASTASRSAGEAPLAASRRRRRPRSSASPCRPVTKAATAKRSVRGDAARRLRREQRAIARLRVRRAPPAAGRGSRPAGDPGAIPTSASMTSASSVIGHAVIASSSSRDAPDPAASSRAQPSAGATTSATSSIERRMNGCGGSIECTCTVRSVARASALSACERGDHLVRGAEMDVERGDQRRRPTSPAACRPSLAQARPVPRQPDLGEAQRLRCGRRRRTRCARPGCAARGPAAAPPDRRRSSGSGSRRSDSVGRARAAGAACATASGRRPRAPARRAPSTEKVACQMRSTRSGIRRIEPIAAGQRRARPRRRAARARCSDEQRRALGAVQAERRVTPRGCRRGRRRPPGGRRDIRSSTAASSATRIGSSSGRVTIAGPQPDARGLRGDLRQEDERRRQAALGFVEMVLGDPGRIEAAALGVDDLRGGQPVALGRGPPDRAGA